MNRPLDAEKARTLEGGPSFSLANRAERFAFALVWRTTAWLLPPPFGWAWRRALLRIFGAGIARGAKIYPSARIWLPRHLRMAPNSTLGPRVECYCMASITLGEGAIVSQRAFLCTGDHRYDHPSHQLVVAPIVIGRRAWVASEAFVGPGVTVGERAVLAARACVTRDVPPATVWAGNPARQVSTRSERDGD